MFSSLLSLTSSHGFRNKTLSVLRKQRKLAVFLFASTVETLLIGNAFQGMELRCARQGFLASQGAQALLPSDLPDPRVLCFTDGDLRAEPTFLPAHRCPSPSVPTAPVPYPPGAASATPTAAPWPGAPSSAAPGSSLPATVRLPAPHGPGKSL